VTSSWIFLSTLYYDARSTTHHILSLTVAHWTWLRCMAETCRRSKPLCCAVGWNWICVYTFRYW